ncbi:MAG: acyltransferase 3 [Ramlibacter sp.]|jgi:peptidoglycan/LPS O-acetylase OafA/YrhL|nr:acyltransferase 3 [Ramlibacter sp.]
MIKSLEGLRGAAALLVALYHLKVGASYLPIVKHGYLFVDLFFVLSGFVIAAAYGDRISTPRDAASFMLRRFGRLFPLLVFATVVFVLAQNVLVIAKVQMVARGLGGALANPGALTYTWPSISEALSVGLFVHSLGLFDQLILNYVSWSISVEFWAYVLFALLVLVFGRRSRTWIFATLSALMFAVTVWGSAVDHQCLTAGKCMDVTYDFGYPRCLFSFLMGALVWRFREPGRRHQIGAQVSALVVLAVLMGVVGFMPAAAFAMPFAFAALIWGMATDAGPVAKALGSRVGVALGARSYSVYMLHPVLLLFVRQFSERSTSGPVSLLIAVAYVGILLLVSGWVYSHLEVPLRNYFNSLAEKIDQRGLAAPPRLA